MSDSTDKLIARFKADKIALGTYEFDAPDDVLITEKGLRIVAPSTRHPTEKHSLNIQKSEIVKIVCQFGPKKSTLIVYVLNTCGKYIRERLEMTLEGESKLLAQTPSSSLCNSQFARHFSLSLSRWLL